MSDREGLIARIRQIRRTAEATTEPAGPGRVGPPQDQVGALEARITHLEQQLQGFQDSVHRESLRQGKRISHLEARTEPAMLSRALSQDARERGL